LLVHDDVNLFPAHERDHGSPVGDPVGNIVPCHSHRVIEVDINDFMLRVSALNPGCLEIVQRFEARVRMAP